MLRADIITGVQAQLDELSTLSTDTPYTDLIDSVLDDAAKWVSKVIPIHLLNKDTMDLSSSQTYKTNYVTVYKPSDFIRLVQMDNLVFERPISEISIPTKEFWGKFTLPGNAKPMMIQLDDIRVVYAPNVIAGTSCTYIKEELPKDMKETSVPFIILKATTEVLSIVQDWNGVKSANEKLIDLIKVNII